MKVTSGDQLYIILCIQIWSQHCIQIYMYFCTGYIGKVVLPGEFHWIIYCLQKDIVYLKLLCHLNYFFMRFHNGPLFHNVCNNTSFNYVCNCKFSPGIFVLAVHSVKFYIWFFIYKKIFCLTDKYPYNKSVIGPKY